MSNKEFEVKEIDAEGLETLNVVAEAEVFNAWMFSSIRDFLKGKTLEIGSGIGNMTSFALKAGLHVTATDLRENYLNFLKKKFDGNSNLDEVRTIDIVHPNFDVEYAAYFEQFDSIFALNIVEHVKDDKQALLNCYKLLKPGGNIAILVPAYQTLYNRFDTELEHYRRYTKKSLNTLFDSNIYTIKKSFHFNSIGIFGWWFSGSVLKKKTIPGGQMKLFNVLVPIFKLVDICSFNRFGLSVITIATKK